MKKYYAIIDTNVVVSAMIKWQSVPGSIMDMSFRGVIVPVLTQDILDEYREVLLRPKFGFTEGVVRDFLENIEDNGIFVDSEHLEIELPDPKDRIFYEVVMKERKDEDAYLVTGNIRHFPIEPFIVTPRQMLDIIVEASSFSD